MNERSLIEAAELVRAASTLPTNPPTSELGTESGLIAGASSWKGWGAGDDLEKVAELMWPNSTWTFATMLNDAQLNALYLGWTLAIRSYYYYLEPNGADPRTVDRISRNYNLPIGRQPLNRRRSARRFSFEKHLADALRCLVYGHYFFEQVGDIDMSPEGFLEWNLRKLGARTPRTVAEINTATDGALESIRQLAGPQSPFIPVDRLVAYVWDREGSNWVGRSQLRPCYRNYLVKDRILRVGAINIERAGGVPYVEAPPGASGDQIKALDQLARRFRVGEGAGAALPHGAQLKFAAAGGGSEAVEYMKFQNEEMARAFLSGVQTLGQSSSGSGGALALGKVQDDWLATAQEAVAGFICDVFNEHVIEDDVEWNEGPGAEYAPLLKFDTSGAINPEAGLQAAVGEDTGLMIDPNGDVAAAIGVKRTRRPKYTPSVSKAPKASTQRAIGAASASPLPLPARPLRRQLFEHEILAAVDFAEMDSQFGLAVDALQAAVDLANQQTIDQLHDAIVDADGDLGKLSALTAEGVNQEVIRQRLAQVAGDGIRAAVNEANRQGVDIPDPDREKLDKAVAERAEAVSQLIANYLAQSASRQAINLSANGPEVAAARFSPAEVAGRVRDFLRRLTGSYQKDLLAGAVQAANNDGRKLAFDNDGEDGVYYASEILDANCCSFCVDVDGSEYPSLSEAERDYPTGGFVGCVGRERCRGTIVKVYTGVERTPTLEVPGA